MLVMHSNLTDKCDLITAKFACSPRACMDFPQFPPTAQKLEYQVSINININIYLMYDYDYIKLGIWIIRQLIAQIFLVNVMHLLVF